MKMMSKQLSNVFLVIAFFSLVLTYCKNEDGPQPSNEPASINISPGGYLVDGNNQTLYIFTRDVDGTNNCTDGCTALWPIYYEENVQFGQGLDAADFEVISLSDGLKQVTYKGWPLYYYSPNGDGKLEAPGSTSGDGVNNIWYIAKPDYDLMIADEQLVGNDGKDYKSDYTEGEGVTKYFVDALGRTLYIFINDSKDTNNFTNSDFSNNGVWPIFYTEINSLPSGMNKDDFDEIQVYGEKQLTFKGWPVYYFGNDEARGENKGVSVPVPGVWPIINNDTQDAM
jgi:predicted lipoprotein with Yx(FWY)xxD motif